MTAPAPTGKEASLSNPLHTNAAGCTRALLAAREPTATLCPSEVARALAENDGGWRGRMDEVHAAVDAMLAAGEIALSWKGATLPRREGPYRIGRAR